MDQNAITKLDGRNRQSIAIDNLDPVVEMQSPLPHLIGGQFAGGFDCTPDRLLHVRTFKTFMIDGFDVIENMEKISRHGGSYPAPACAPSHSASGVA